MAHGYALQRTTSTDANLPGDFLYFSKQYPLSEIRRYKN